MLMEEAASADRLSRTDRVRRLGFNPDYLTPDEQRELLEMQSLFARPERDAARAEYGDRARTEERLPAAARS
jgi:hypothetical protein